MDAHAKGLEVNCRIAPGIPSLVRGDAARLRQVLNNLMGNAVKFTQSGEISVQLSVEEESESTTTLRFTVTDTGVGFPQERALSLFAAFEQGDTSSTRRYGGTGLGPTICKRLVELMGGHIGANSEVGKGSTFWFSTKLDKQSSGARTISEMPVSLRDARILVVDDNETSRSVLRGILQSWNCRVYEAADAGAAASLIAQSAATSKYFQFVLLDITLPGMTAEDLARDIRKDPRLTNTLLVSMGPIGAKINGLDALNGPSHHFAGHISKPVWEHNLRDVLINVNASDQRAAAVPLPATAAGQKSARKNSQTRLIGGRQLDQSGRGPGQLKTGLHTQILLDGMGGLNALVLLIPF